MGNYSKKIRGFWVILIATLLTGCALEGEDSFARRPPAVLDETPLDPAARHAYLSQFPLLNEDGDLEPPRESSAFGVLLKLPQKGGITVCSATHIAPGLLATNAHCLPGYPNARVENFYAVYFSRLGKRRYTPIEKFEYVGNPDSDDVAILGLPAKASKDWESVQGRVVSLADTIGAHPAATVAVNVWAYDPFPANSRDGHRFSKPGMRFNPRRCLLSRTLPQVNGVEIVDGEQTRVDILESTNAKESLHVFLDNCNQDFVLGNSGSLISLLQSPGDRIGVYHWVVGPTDVAKERFQGFEYTGNDGRTKPVTKNAQPLEFFGVGFSFENLKQVAELFGSSRL